MYTACDTLVIVILLTWQYKCNHSSVNGMLFSFHSHLIICFDKTQLYYCHSVSLATLSKEIKYHLHFPDYRLRCDLETRFSFSIIKQKFHCHKYILKAMMDWNNFLPVT